METEVLIVDAGIVHANELARAARVLAGGGLVGFPTETVYGIGVRADNSQAVARLRAVKGREVEKALTVHIGAKEEAERYVSALSGIARRLIRRAWPGPLTLVLPVGDPSTTAVLAGLNGSAASAMYYDGTVGLRCPDHPIATELLRDVGVPVVATSANLSGQRPAQTAGEALKELKGRIDLLLDAGRSKYSKPSTVVRVRDSSFEILREGVLDARIVEQMAACRILFVCSGNTCRSPMAAGLARKIIAQRLGCDVASLASHGIIVESAGTGGGHGPASEHAVSVMAARGIDLSGHVSSSLRAEALQQADYVFAMTQAQVEAAFALAPGAADRVCRLLDDEDVADPFGAGRESYEACALKIEQGVESRLREVCT